MTPGRSQVLATSNFRDWYAVVDEIPWSSLPKTTMDCDSLLWLPHCALPLYSKLALTCNICRPSVNMHCNSFTNHFSDADRNRQIILPLGISFNQSVITDTEHLEHTEEHMKIMTDCTVEK